MPTGSGKTRTCTSFLLKDMISDGYQVVWLTHRHLLIDQTAEAFYNGASMVKINNPEADVFKIACISGKHSSMRCIEKDDDVMILSIQSGCRGLEYLKKSLASKVVIVVDEAHHTYAKSYRKTIDYIRKIRKSAKLLGLTATPIRANELESGYLLDQFENSIIYDVSMSELIKKQILANPKFEQIATNFNVEPVISTQEIKLLKRYGEIPATLAEKIAHSSKRNQLIVNTYMQNREKYGKTLIFALNAYHCVTLSKEFQQKGIKCDYIYSGNSDNEAKIKRFKNNEKDNGLDVLVNINILTEGSDVPDIQTVFLTRPTQSEGLLMQMIGRGMRGKFAGGTDDINIVDFNDTWDTFNKWLNPKWVMLPAINSPKPKEYDYKSKVTIPCSLILKIYDSITFNGEKSLIKFTTMPVGWYSLIDDEGNDYTLLVFEEQISGYKKLIKENKNKESRTKLLAKTVLAEYFGGFVKAPNEYDINLFINNWIEEGTMPHLYRFQNRENIDPTKVAAKLFKENIGIADLKVTIKAIYNDEVEIINNLFGDYEVYYDRIIECVKYPNGVLANKPKISEIPIELIPFRQEQVYDIELLKTEVIDEMFEGQYDGIESVEWTDKPYNTYYGIYYNGGKIRINCLLNSPDVPRETVKFIIYHELLHRDYGIHDKEFYYNEHKYPEYTEHNKFLDYKMGKFSFSW